MLENHAGTTATAPWESKFLSTLKPGRAHPGHHPSARPPGRCSINRAGAVAVQRAPPRPFTLAAIGASTSGSTAIVEVLRALPADFALPVLLVLHIGAPFGDLDSPTGSDGRGRSLQVRCFAIDRPAARRDIPPGRGAAHGAAPSSMLIPAGRAACAIHGPAQSATPVAPRSTCSTTRSRARPAPAPPPVCSPGWVGTARPACWRSGGKPRGAASTIAQDRSHPRWSTECRARRYLLGATRSGPCSRSSPDRSRAWPGLAGLRSSAIEIEADMNETVLIVDDSLTVRMDLAEAFEAAGFRALPCATAADARRALRDEPVKLVILDVRLPDGDGIDLLKEIRASAAGAEMPILMLSSEAEVKDRIRGLRTGADEVPGQALRHRLHIGGEGPCKLLRRGAPAASTATTGAGDRRQPDLSPLKARPGLRVGRLRGPWRRPAAKEGLPGGRQPAPARHRGRRRSPRDRRRDRHPARCALDAALPRRSPLPPC